MKTRGVVGGLEMIGVNETGELILEMCVRKEIAGCNTLFKRREIHKTTLVR